MLNHLGVFAQVTVLRRVESVQTCVCNALWAGHFLRIAFASIPSQVYAYGLRVAAPLLTSHLAQGSSPTSLNQQLNV